MKYFYLEPEVAGGLGRNTVMDRSKHPPLVQRLHYVFDGWLGDALLESFPCFIVTESLKEKLFLVGATGVRFQSVEVTMSEEFRDFHPITKLPDFVWIQIEGIPMQDDFGIGEDLRLIISERVLQILLESGINHAKVTEI